MTLDTKIELHLQFLTRIVRNKCNISPSRLPASPTRMSQQHPRHPDMPVIAVAPNDHPLDKLKSSHLKEVQTRGGDFNVFAERYSDIPEFESVHNLHLPEHYGERSPDLHVVSYRASLVKGADVDKPRNLAKSVTVV